MTVIREPLDTFFVVPSSSGAPLSIILNKWEVLPFLNPIPLGYDGNISLLHCRLIKCKIWSPNKVAVFQSELTNTSKQLRMHSVSFFFLITTYLSINKNHLVLGDHRMQCFFELAYVILHIVRLMQRRVGKHIVQKGIKPCCICCGQFGKSVRTGCPNNQHGLRSESVVVWAVVCLMT